MTYFQSEEIVLHQGLPAPTSPSPFVQFSVAVFQLLVFILGGVGGGGVRVIMLL